MGDILKDKVAVVTGSGGGIGKAIAISFADESAKVVVNDIGGEKDGTGASALPADRVVQEIKDRGGIAVANYDSVTEAQGGENIIKTAVDNFGRIDILVNMAGIIRDRMIFNMTEEDWDSVIKVHLYGHFHTTKPACVLMRQQRSGRIINIVSISAFGNMGQANYGAAKAGILGFTRTVARDMGRYGVTCNAVIPTAPTRLGWSPEVKAAWEKRAAAGDMRAKYSLETLERIAPEDNAPIFIYLASDASSNVNGCLFYARGNWIALYGDPIRIKTIYTKERWTTKELMESMPESLAEGLVNPAPPQPPK